MPNPVVHFEVHGKDAKKSQDFYSQLFDWHVDSNNPMDYGMVDTHTDGNGINGGITTSEGAPNVIFYVEVNDLQAYLDKAEGLGGKTIMPPTEIPNTVTMALFSDLDGNLIGMVKEGSGQQ
jgi:predicted enzyme related to lactoylglutathione lyase